MRRRLKGIRINTTINYNSFLPDCYKSGLKGWSRSQDLKNNRSQSQTNKKTQVPKPQKQYASPVRAPER